MKKAVAFFAVMLIVLSVFSQNLFSFANNVSPHESKEKEYPEVLERFSVFKASKVEKRIREAEEARKRELERLLSEEKKRKRIEQTLSNIKNGKTSLRKVFANTCFVGDSLINGLETYNILNSDKIISQVSARFSHLEDNIKKIRVKTIQDLAEFCDHCDGNNHVILVSHKEISQYGDCYR